MGDTSCVMEESHVAVRIRGPAYAGQLLRSSAACVEPAGNGMLKADIDSGATGDKVEHYDVGMA
jgi:hypothetical protein